MIFTSYAQNFEDVMLWRALKHVSNGFYVDVGANDPTLYSVTRAFYERGWHGLNIEPVENFHLRLVEERPRDVNLKVAAGNESATMSISNVADSGLATLDSNLGAGYANSGWRVQSEEVQVLPLRLILAEQQPAEIHFLKIDVEGFEEQVLRGMDFKRWRPWILVIEATRPMSQETNHETWEAIVTDADYQFAYFDGLNRFYVASEHLELRDSFKLPPNVFDGFTFASDIVSSLRADEAEKRAAIARDAAVSALQAEGAAREAEAAAREAEEGARAAENEAREAERVAREAALGAAAQAADALRRADEAQGQIEALHMSLVAVQSTVRRSHAELVKARSAAGEAQMKMRSSEGRAGIALKRAAEAEIRVNEVLASTSWRVTAPLRAIRTGSSTFVTKYRRVRATPPKILAAVIKRRVVSRSKRVPGVIKVAQHIRVHYPKLWFRLRGAIVGGYADSGVSMASARWNAGVALGNVSQPIEGAWENADIPGNFLSTGTAGLDTDRLMQRVIEVSGSGLRPESDELAL